MKDRATRWLFVFVAIITVLAVISLNAGCSTLSGFGKDLTAASDGIAKKAAER